MQVQQSSSRLACRPRRTTPARREEQTSVGSFSRAKTEHQLREGLRSRVAAAAVRYDFCFDEIKRHMTETVEKYVAEKDQATCLGMLPEVMEKVVPSVKRRTA